MQGDRSRTGGLTPGRPWANWSRAVSVRPQFTGSPRSVDEVVSAVAFARERGLPVKAIGAGHSFTAIAVAPGVQLELSALSGIIEADASTGRVRLGAGTHLHELPALLRPLGLALENMGDIDRQTIAGATSTGTHGTGATFGGLATQIVALTLVTADGSVLTVSEYENAELLPAARLGLGALGVIVDVTIQCVPAFLLQAVEKPEPFDAVVDTFEQRASAVDHFEFYWFPHTTTALTKTNTRLPSDASPKPLGRIRRWVDDSVMANGVFALTCGLGRMAPAAVPGINSVAARLTGDRSFTDWSPDVFVTERSVRFREMEYALPRAAVPEALRQIRALIRTRGWRISFPIEVRVAAADENWLSTAYGRESGYIAVHRYFREDHSEYFRAVEQIMRAHDGRPHWGKLHYRDAPELSALYPRFADFTAVRDRLDPERVFGNPYLGRVLGP
ncbi:FAD-linked oxidoreductase [Homoserinimonas aerilata]|uniref:FAD-linked oxidoreductase n=1 Tax=Homoserinimonas aerilata TaxID=1162970 RepID=A0A542YGQ1_9MICO|nr:FAD-linked oxidoreductase [Homoserinimonas aerilata]